jgi:hypothetical protein
MSDQKEEGFFQGKNKPMLMIVAFTAIGVITLPVAKGMDGVNIFPALFSGIFFGMAAMLGYVMFVTRAKGSNAQFGGDDK